MKNKMILRLILLILAFTAIVAVAPGVGAVNVEANASVADENGDGVYEISTAGGLYYMVDNPTLSYELTADIDMRGIQWTPISWFSGNLDGNGHTISNLTINQGVPDYYAPAEMNMGFFGDTSRESVISDLHLRNVTVNADKNARYIGILTGTSRGTITGCTVTGSINDTRQNINGDKIYIGVFAGRVTLNATASILPGNTLSVTDDAGIYTVSGLCAAVQIKTPDGYAGKASLVGWQPSGYTCNGLWADSTYDSADLSETMQDRQDVVVDYMYEMGTVPWQVSEPLDYIPIGGTGSVHRQKFKTGVTYYGLPYASNAGSLERFMSKIDSSTGRNITIEGLEDGYYDNGYYGFVQYMGNDCSSAVAWAWMRVSPSRVNGTSDTEYAGGAHVRYTVNMVPNEQTQSVRGIYPVGEWTTVSKNNDNIVGDFAYTVTTETDTEQIYKTNGKEVLAQAYAMTRKADALVYYSDVKVGGHARLAAEDPVVIRNGSGAIDTSKSFFVTHEQGDGLYDRKSTNSSWRINYKYTFESLLNTDYNTSDGSSGGVYVPITMRALRNDYVKHAYFNEYPDVPVVNPVKGKVHSNFRIISSTVTVTDQEGKVLYDNEVYTGISPIHSETRATLQTVDLSAAHMEDYTAAAKAAHMTIGTQYYFTVKILLSNGMTMTVSDNKAFIAENDGADIYVEPKPDYNGLVPVDGAWGYYEGGELQEDYTGLVPYGDILFYVENGILDFSYTGLVWHLDAWRYVANSQLTEGYTGLVWFNDNWFYTVDSVIDWTFTGLVPYEGNYFYVQNNLLDWSYTGLGYHDGGWYFIQNGLLQKEYSGLVYFNDNWFYVEEGVLTYQYFGMVEYEGNLFYVQASHLDWNYTGLGYHEGNWYYFQNALYTPSFSGLVPFNGSLFYVKDGTIDWSFNGSAEYEGKTYTVVDGVVEA